MSRRLRRDLHKRISSAGYQKFSGDIEVDGRIIGPSIERIVTAIQKIVAGTTTPVQLTISRCEGAFKAIILQWLVQYNLMNFDHYEVQVSDDDATWYSLEFDGTDWKDAADADTDVVYPLLVHIPIPFGGTEAEPSGKTLYYRMRQVTILGATSAWSASASATSATIQTGDLAANIITANKILAGTITATELAALIITAREIAFSGGVYTPDDPAPTDSVIIDLAQPDCIASNGVVPNSDKEIVYVAPYWEDENGVKTWNPATKLFDGGGGDPTRQGAIGIFQATPNLAKDPEDLRATGVNWTAVNTTDELSDLYYDGKRFTKIINSGANAGYNYQSFIDEWTTLTPSFSVIIKKGSSAGNTTRLSVRNTTTASYIFSIIIDFDNYPNAPGTATEGGTLHDYKWYDSETLEVRIICASLGALTDDLRIWCFGSNNLTNAEYTYWTAVLAVDLPYPPPYTPTSRVAGKLDLPIALVNKFTLIFWVRPWFTYDTASEHQFVEWYIDATHRLMIRYEHNVDKVEVWWRDGGTARVLHSQVFDDSGANDINQWIMVAMAIDLSAQGQTASRLKVYTEAGSIGEDTDWGGAPDAFTGPFPLMHIGHLVGASQTDSLLTDLIYIPDTVFTEAQMDAHYAANRPWYSPTEITNEAKSVRIDKAGIRMHNASLTITDNRNRLIDISNRTGLLAKDAAGVIIHDIADAPVQIDNQYCGHIYWYQDDATLYKIYDVTGYPEQSWTEVTCMIHNSTNVKAGIFLVYLYGVAAPPATHFKTYCGLRPKGSSWAVSVANPTPTIQHEMYADNVVAGGIQHMLLCPIGDDNKIEFYAYTFPDSVSRRLLISQLGVLM